MELRGLIVNQGWLLSLIQLLAWGVFLGLWVVVASQDWRENKIHHRHLSRGAAFAAVCYGLMLAATILGRSGKIAIYYDASFYQALVLHIASAAAMGVGLWYAGVWPAGDAKLYIFLGALYPMMRVSGSFYMDRLFLIVLINIFVPAAAGLSLQALHYAWQTRLKHQGIFFSQLGWRRGLDFMASKMSVASFMEQASVSARALLTTPGRSASSALRWLAAVASMSLISCVIQREVSSPAVKIFFCCGLYYLWSKVQRFGLGWLLFGAAAAAFSAAWQRAPDEGLAALATAFGHITAFAVAVSLGMSWMQAIIAGRLGAWGWVIVMLAGSFVPAFFASLSWGPSLLGWVAMGGLFGLSFVLVRHWEADHHPNMLPDHLKTYMVLHREFIERLRQDPEFFRAHFQRSYADGLTPEQIAALQDWCRRNGVTLIPLAPTIAFSHWIFLGYFITWLIDGSVLRRL